MKKQFKTVTSFLRYINDTIDVYLFHDLPPYAIQDLVKKRNMIVHFSSVKIKKNKKSIRFSFDIDGDQYVHYNKL